ncbi:DUF2267 domain-containing protein [Streptosporangium sandarakinum]
MEYKEFVQTVADRTVLTREEAADLTRAVMRTLGTRLSSGEARYLAERLPDSLGELIPAEGRSEQFGLDDFITRVARHAGLNTEAATEGVQAVLRVLRETVSDEVFGHVASQLPGGFERMAGSAT